MSASTTAWASGAARRPRPLRPAWIRRLGMVAAATAFGVLLFGRWNAERVVRGSSQPALGHLVEDLASVYSVLALLPPVAWTARRARLSMDSTARWHVHLLIHAAALLAFSAVHTTLAGFSRTWLVPLFVPGAGDHDGPLRYMLELPNDAIVYGLLVIGVEKVDRLRGAIHQEVRTAELEALWARARLDNLRLQLHPHFLFNALNTISGVMYENVQIAETMIAKLGDLLRAALRTSNRHEVPLREEVVLLEGYLDIMRARFEDRLRVRVAVDDAALDAMVPPLLLQPLAENAIRHGNLPREGQAMIEITVRRAPQRLWIEVGDNGSGAVGDEGSSKGIGLASTAERLRHLYGNDHSLEVSSAPGKGFRVTIGLPCRKLAANET